MYVKYSSDDEDSVEVIEFVQHYFASSSSSSNSSSSSEAGSTNGDITEEILDKDDDGDDGDNILENNETGKVSRTMKPDGRFFLGS